jgi:hypothetical protein
VFFKKRAFILGVLPRKKSLRNAEVDDVKRKIISSRKKGKNNDRNRRNKRKRSTKTMKVTNKGM